MALIEALESSIPNEAVIHPIVLLSVVDHYNRVARGTKRRVVGTLLGKFPLQRASLLSPLVPSLFWSN